MYGTSKPLFFLLKKKDFYHIQIELVGGGGDLISRQLLLSKYSIVLYTQLVP